MGGKISSKTTTTMKKLYCLALVLACLRLCRAEHEDFLKPHNDPRTAVGVGPLSWNNTLQTYAEQYANQRKGDCALQHSNGPYGENIFWGSGDGFTNADAVKLWVDEKQYYNYDSNTCATGQMCGHYTQVVWRNTKYMGCARIVCDGNQGVFITCNYDPPGNYIGEKPY